MYVCVCQQATSEDSPLVTIVRTTPNRAGWGAGMGGVVSCLSDWTSSKHIKASKERYLLGLLSEVFWTVCVWILFQNASSHSCFGLNKCWWFDRVHRKGSIGRHVFRSAVPQLQPVQSGQRAGQQPGPGVSRLQNQAGGRAPLLHRYVFTRPNPPRLHHPLRMLLFIHRYVFTGPKRSRFGPAVRP